MIDKYSIVDLYDTMDDEVPNGFAHGKAIKRPSRAGRFQGGVLPKRPAKKNRAETASRSKRRQTR
jgi:hypothetical protein